MNSDLSLAEQNIVLCKKGTPPLDKTKTAELLELLPEWYVEANTGISQLVRNYDFPDSAEAVQFSRFIKAMADAANHHPLLQLEENTLNVRWWTHTIKGLHLNDFIMAARCDELYSTIQP
jgi:4a-hydroxytetrahydrobiopterin dehydratase